MITCSDCSAENADDSAHCGQCGKPLQQTGAKKTMLAFALSPEKLQEAAAAAKAAREARGETASADRSESKLKLPKPGGEQKEPLDPFAQTMMMGPDDAAQLAATKKPQPTPRNDEPAAESDPVAGFGSRDTPEQIDAVSAPDPTATSAASAAEKQYTSEPSGRAATMSHLDEIPATPEANKHKALIIKAAAIFAVLATVALFTMFLLSGN